SRRRSGQAHRRRGKRRYFLTAIHLFHIGVSLGLAAAGLGQPNQPAIVDSYSYSAAFISTTDARRTELVVFPLHGNKFKVPIRSASGPFAYSPDGSALYGQCTLGSNGEPVVSLCKIELETNNTES